jgi:hypothetical protein
MATIDTSLPPVSPAASFSGNASPLPRSEPEAEDKAPEPEATKASAPQAEVYNAVAQASASTIRGAGVDIQA